MVSHCKTDSKREEVVGRLSDLTNLTIDIYGKCGDREHRLPPETSDDMSNNIESPFHKRQSKTYKIFRSDDGQQAKSICESAKKIQVLPFF